mmetsp:Transcript_3567/g.6314  ORF Transcript_3567/g.6314 Transcript_3567/m.6314 type:complete len:213 (-) Transcript_3567:2223-2861(-)
MLFTRVWHITLPAIIVNGVRVSVWSGCSPGTPNGVGRLRAALHFNGCVAHVLNIHIRQSCLELICSGVPFDTSRCGSIELDPVCWLIGKAVTICACEVIHMDHLHLRNTLGVQISIRCIKDLHLAIVLRGCSLIGTNISAPQGVSICHLQLGHISWRVTQAVLAVYFFTVVLIITQERHCPGETPIIATKVGCTSADLNITNVQQALKNLFH